MNAFCCPLTYSIKFRLGTADIITLIGFDFETISFTCLFIFYLLLPAQPQINKRNSIQYSIFTIPISGLILFISFLGLVLVVSASGFLLHGSFSLVGEYI